jgi:putative restriction endonuclease
MRFWWASQNQTYRQETEGGYLWSPKRNKGGGFNPFYEFMKELAPGDLVFSFADTWIRKIGIVQGYCFESPQPPEFGALGQRVWDNIGWSVSVRFFPLAKPIRPKDHMDLLRPLRPERYAPLQDSGDGNVLYLTSVPERMAQTMGDLIGADFKTLVSAATDVPIDEKARGAIEYEQTQQWERHLVDQIQGSYDIGPTEREAIVQARTGQGRFRKNVARIETHCRVTRVNEPTHLRASHTKPWRTSTNEERLNGENGLLLTPTIDHLFDRGFIAFEDSGELLISPVAYKPSLQKMGIPCDQKTNVGSFSLGQKQFLAYHRENVFLSRRTA